MSVLFSCSMFFLSFTPLWISIIFIDVVNILTNEHNLWTEIISIFCIILSLIFSGIQLYLYVKKNTPQGMKRYTMLEAKEEKTISVEFLLSYVMPLFAFDFTQWQQTILFLHIFLVLCWLCVKHKHFSNNVVLEALEYRVYSCVLESEDGKKLSAKVIAKNHLSLSIQDDIEVEFINNDFLIER